MPQSRRNFLKVSAATAMVGATGGRFLRALQPCIPDAAPELSQPGYSAVEPLPSTQMSDYTPIGVWIANWEDLFPWLADGIQNTIGDLGPAESVIRYRTMLQDFLALSKLYYTAQNCNFGFASVGCQASDLRQIADSFASGCSKLQDRFQNQRAGSLNSADYDSAIQDAYAHLSKAAQKIYKKWNELYFLRGCELGLGIVDSDSCSYSVNEDGKSVWSDIPLISNNRFFLTWRQACAFSPDRKDYESFASFYKVLPLIHPDGERIFAFGPGSGMLAATFKCDRGFLKNMSFGCFASKDSHWKWGDSLDGLSAWPNSAPLEFTPNSDGPLRCLENKAHGFKLYPVPFSAAKGVEWKGQSLSRNVASDSDLRAQLKELTSQLEAGPSWSFSSDQWRTDWKGDDYYRFSLIPTQYLGLLDESDFRLR
jgi:hypothetical protein